FVHAMENVLDVYERPYDEDNPVINLDESPKQLIGEKKNSFTDSKGIKYEDFEYERKGVVDIYMIAEPKAGKRKVLIKDDHKSKTYAHVIRHIAEEMYPPEKYSRITCLFRLKSIPVFQFKSIPLMVNKKGLGGGIWPMGQIPSSNRRFFFGGPLFFVSITYLYFLSVI